MAETIGADGQDTGPLAEARSAEATASSPPKPHGDLHAVPASPLPTPGRRLREIFSTAQGTFNFFIGITTIIVSFETIHFLLVDHTPKPRMDVVFSNRTDTVEVKGSDLGNGVQHVLLDIYVRNQGNARATNVDTHEFLDENLADSIFDESADPAALKLIRLDGEPPSYELRQGPDFIDPAGRKYLGRLEFELPPGTYSIATEVDTFEQDEPAVGTLHFTVLP